MQTGIPHFEEPGMLANLLPQAAARIVVRLTGTTGKRSINALIRIMSRFPGRKGAISNHRSPTPGFSGATEFTGCLHIAPGLISSARDAALIATASHPRGV
ncbi:MAG: hypothetical protein ONB48_07920 [candidate division KSB1 bacterium]|nr:hypothetical protein [candidate division KSB1 bacterium]MDZ7274750.1 hypothetical protein [candidate division KSB1 bacterium]MDZ7285575.1 hypothetical protein [candidate division KSB1 bacterium]MDZ7298607.1 hypothetical protein [candidate division KSB1 bacterium]MDZ7309537.1 hypothetical protein [candidate division KSB1 bacterium]